MGIRLASAHDVASVISTRYLNLKKSETGRRSFFAIFSKASNEGALIPRSIRLKKSTEMSIASANCS